MSFAYIVRCNFAAPAKEPAWNAWYSGPKIEQMLAKPHFRTCQRFKRIVGPGRDYLALWTVASPDAFRSREYTTDWGFFEWEPFITDWSRDLFDARQAPQGAFEVALGGALRVAALDGLMPAEASAARADIARAFPDLTWLPVIGLDRHTPLIGVQALADGREEPANGPPAGAAARHVSTYRPISPCHRARR